jgi:hypothetical protein
VGIGVTIVYRQTAVFILLMYETHTVFFNDSLFAFSRMKGKNSPGGPIDEKLPTKPVDEASLRKKSSK